MSRTKTTAIGVPIKESQENILAQPPRYSTAEKSISPTGGNLFTPTVKAPGPQTAAPGNLPGNSPK